MEDMDDLFALLEMLKMAIKGHNSEQSDNIMKQIMGFSYPEDMQQKIDELNLHIVNFEEDDALLNIDALQK